MDSPPVITDSSTTEHVDIGSYEQSVLNELMSSKQGAEQSAETSQAETQDQPSQTSHQEEATEAAQGRAGDAEEQSSKADRLARLERVLEADRDRVRRERDLATKEREVAKLAEFQKDPANYLEQNHPDLLERWLQMRYARLKSGEAGGGQKDAPEQDASPAQKRLDELQRKYDELEKRLTTGTQQRIVDEYRRGVSAAESKIDTQQMQLARDYCSAKGFDLQSEVVSYAATMGERTGKVPNEQESLQAVVKYIVSELESSEQLLAKHRRPSEPAPRTLTSSMKSTKASQPKAKPENETVPMDLDAYKKHLLAEWSQAKRRG